MALLPLLSARIQLLLFISAASITSLSNGIMTQKNNPSGEGLPFPEMLETEKSTKVVMNDDATPSSSSSTKSEKIVSVCTRMNYVTQDTVEINMRRNVAGCDSVYEGATWDPVEVQVENARNNKNLQQQESKKKTLHEHGFELIDNSPVDDDLDYLNTNEVIDKYYPSCEELIRQVLGEDKVDVVKAFDHNIRISSNSFGNELKGGGGSKAQVPLGMVHGDYTLTSGPKRLEDLSHPPKANDVLKTKLGDKPLLDPKLVQETKIGKRRFALINVWRSIDVGYPVEEVPLACIDSATVVNQQDLRILKIHYKDRIGQNYFLSHSSSHKWYYFPSMLYHEALLIKQWDSFGDFCLESANNNNNNNNKEISQTTNRNNISTFAAHSAFADPTSPKNARPRKSIEVRVAIIWKE